jgi:hypothetical protein
MIFTHAGAESSDSALLDNGVTATKRASDAHQQRSQNDDFIELAVDKAITDVSAGAHTTH